MDKSLSKNWKEFSSYNFKNSIKDLIFLSLTPLINGEAPNHPRREQQKPIIQVINYFYGVKKENQSTSLLCLREPGGASPPLYFLSLVPCGPELPSWDEGKKCLVYSGF